VKPTDDSLEIRSARRDDAPALAALLRELGFPTHAPAVARRLDGMLDAGEAVLVAVREGKVLGLVTVHITPVLHRSTSVGRLTALVVGEQARGQGIGRALVNAGEEVLATRGCELVEVTSNAKAVSQCFTENAVVKDEGHTHKGRAAIKAWKTYASAKYQYTCEPLACEEKDGKTVVTSHLVGNFPGSPVDLRYFFKLRGNRIASSEIIP
jgi:N-acetylglutamate synthase-like GNAT family acetyltransferase